ncbi:MAG: DUF5317 family protein [Acidimicrobiales bacterium]
MLILPLAVLVGSLAGWAAKGSWRATWDIRFWHPSVVLAAAAGQEALELPWIRAWPAGLRFALVVATYLVIGWWLFENARSSSGGVRLGFRVVGVGWALNLLVILPNEGMPVSESALDGAGIAPSTSVIHGHLAKHVSMNHGTVLRGLGDVIPLSWFRTVLSPGDIVMAVGIAVLVAAVMRTPASADSPQAEAPPLPAPQVRSSD